ncbi:MAG: hypoxanthine phosphoribosyltransferase [Saprospiraceae bacterium]
MYIVPNHQLPVQSNIEAKLVSLHGKNFQRIISQDDIQQRVGELGSILRMQYEGKRPLFIGILNGAFVFAADLVRAYAEECEIVFVRLASYSGTSSTGKINTVIGLESGDIEGRDIIIVEDIVDTGRTLSEFIKMLQDYNPASVSIVTCFLKPDALNFDLKPELVGFSIPTKFIVGYGLDYDGLGRNLSAIYQLVE